MYKVSIFFALLLTYLTYSGWIYTGGTNTVANMSPIELEGKHIFEKNNCQSCHQLFGLGGYLGPDLTTAVSNKNKGTAYARAILQSGGSRMPVFHFSEKEINALISYFTYVDRNANKQVKFAR